MDALAPLSPAERALLVAAPLPKTGLAGWARGGRLPHPGIPGLRDDTAPEEVVRE